jgi:hypothetical protein
MSQQLIAVTLLAWGIIPSACASGGGGMGAGVMTTNPTKDTRLQAGIWGGEHVKLEVRESGAHVEFNCANGDIPQPLTTTDDGRLDVEGVFVRERPGPIRVGEEPVKLRARYSGKLTKDSLTFDVTLVDSNENAGRFTVVRGEPAVLPKCR